MHLNIKGNHHQSSDFILKRINLTCIKELVKGFLTCYERFENDINLFEKVIDKAYEIL